MQSTIAVPYQLFDALNKKPFNLITHLYELIQECRDPLYVKALSCIIASNAVAYSDLWKALYWDAEVQKQYQKDIIVIDLPSGPLLTLLLRGHPLRFGLLVPCDRSMLSDPDPLTEAPKVLVCEAKEPDNQCALTPKILADKNPHYIYFLYPIVFDIDSMKAYNYMAGVYVRPGMRGVKCILYR